MLRRSWVTQGHSNDAFFMYVFLSRPPPPTPPPKKKKKKKETSTMVAPVSMRARLTHPEFVAPVTVS